MNKQINEQDLIIELNREIDIKRILYKDVDLISYSYDASFYYLKPKVVVRPINIKEIQFLMFIANQYKIPLTFRTAGTSLSGQAVGNGIIVDIGFSQSWNQFQIINEGEKIRFEPGIIGQHLNYYLKHYKRKIGPDPASINSCMMGGILANNASGMCCGIEFNSYHTLTNIKAVLSDGYIFNTFDVDCEEKLRKEQSNLYSSILKIKNQILNNPELYQKIKNKYKIKNTTGYSLNAFIDFNKVSEILSHLLIGSEGTLGFIAEAELKTIPDLPYKYTGLLSFDNIFDACESIPYLIKMKASSLELMDRASIRSIENKPDVTLYLKKLPKDATCLLAEFEFENTKNLEKFKREWDSKIKHLKLIHKPDFTDDDTKRNLLWKIRKGLFPSVGAIREKGTTVIIEDIAFPLETLPYAVLELQGLFQKHDYKNAIIFGHAKDGNLHFVISQSFNDNKSIEKYNDFINDVVELVTKKYHGSLKAEHGTGRNMAPFVKQEWGEDAYQIMKEIKILLDPNNILNPGIIINEDPNAHIKNLKTIPSFTNKEIISNYHNEFDLQNSLTEKCIECGFCESVCPSKYLTTTPRKRIILQREIYRNPNFIPSKHFDDYFFDTCVGCGLCEFPCPVDINTGNFVKAIKNKKYNLISHKIAEWTTKYFALLEFFISFLFNLFYYINKFFPRFLEKLQFQLNKKFRIPYIYPSIKNTNFRKFIKKSEIKNNQIDYYYFPTCVSRIFGNNYHKKELFEIIKSITENLNINLKIIDSRGFCCSQPYESKGYLKAKKLMINKTKKLLEKLDPNIPIIIDNTSCTNAFKINLEYKNFKILDSIEWIYQLYKKYPEKFNKIYNKIYLQNLCSLQKTNLTNKLQEILSAISNSVDISPFSECCGFAGDKGMFFPKLVSSSTTDIKIRLKKENYNAYTSSNLTCEIGLTYGTEKRFQHFLYLVYHSIINTTE